MSTYADPSKARVWLDGDAFRAPAGTTLPTDIFASALTGWDAYGGIKAGFTLTTDRESTNIDVWNNTSGGPYKRRKQPPSASIKFRPVDYSAATVMTLIRGGSVTEVGTDSGIFEMIEGSDEEFAFIMRVQDGAQKKAYYINTCELLTIPEEVMGADDDVEGWDLELGPLAPSDGSKAVRKFLTVNPLDETP
ncbi:MAG: hypothetical protein EKK42_20390 [Pseudonocardiaceae bacterium]|nr:MAG: hypothetical protein EKK42_20390 [Pseudonocardiaceae bacterium]